MGKRRWASRFEKWAKGNALLTAFFFVSTLLSALIVIVGAGIWVADQYNEKFNWRDKEYETLTSLHAGFTRAKFEDELGEPVFDRQAGHGKYREQTFRGREYWVQAISDHDGTVQVYSVTACGKDFRPTFEIAGGSTEGGPRRLTLNSSRVASVVQGKNAASISIDYFASGATANSRFYDAFSGGNPSNYKTFLWGLNDVCSDWFRYYASLLRKNLLPTAAFGAHKGLLVRMPPWVGRFRNSAVANTYAETAPLFLLTELEDAFQVGVDRILTRTTGEASPSSRVLREREVRYDETVPRAAEAPSQGL